MINEPVTTLCQAFQFNVSAIPDRPAVRASDGRVSFTWSEYQARVQRLAAGLAGVGVGRGDTVAIMLTNRPEFHVVDSAALHVGAAPVSLYNTASAEQIHYVLSNAESRIVFCEQQFVAKLLTAIGGTEIEYLVCVDGDSDGALTLSDIEERALPGFDFDKAWRSVVPSDVATVVYTSGTTGPPKGVQLTHANIVAEFAAIADIASFDATDSVISYLPDAHAANRIQGHYASIVTGMQVVTVADPKTVIDALTDLHPTMFFAVPQIWYKLKAKLEATLAAEHGVKKVLATWAIDTGIEVATRKSEGKSVPVALGMQHAVAELVVLSKLRAKLGMDKFKAAFSGAAPIAPEALTFVMGIGIPICEVWGMSETTGMTTFNPLDAPRIGTVGKPALGMRIKLADDGEILVKGPLVTTGYRNDADKTAEAIDLEGWLATGDVGTIDSEGYLSIVDRKKELIINAAGKNMSPANIENTVKLLCPLIGSIAAIGDNRKYITALITLDPEAAAEFAVANSITDASLARLAGNTDVRAQIDAGIAAANARLSRVEQIKKYTLLPKSWEPGGAELTPTMKLKRKPIAQIYHKEIDALYT